MEDTITTPSPNITPLLRLATLNITDARNARLNTAIRCMKDMKVDVAVLTETKLHHDRYTKSTDGYNVVATTADKRKGGVALIYRTTSDGWALESICCFGKNVIRGTLVSGQRRQFIVGAYIPPSETDGSTLACITAACQKPRGSNWPLILLGDFNCDFNDLGDPSRQGAGRRMETATLIDALGVECMRKHFRQRKKWIRRPWTWMQRRNGALVGSVCDHILSDDRTIFTNCQLKRPRFDTDHLILVSTLKLSSVSHHRRYARTRSTFPIRLTIDNASSEADRIHAELAECREKKGKTNGRDNSWIRGNTWTLIDRRIDARKLGEGQLARELGRQIRKSLKKDRRNRTTAVAQTIETLLTANEPREAFQALQGWYKDVGPRPTLPSREEIDATRDEFQQLYTAEIPQSPPVPIHVTPFAIADEPPGEEEIIDALLKLRNFKAAGPSGLRVEDLKSWYHAARGDPRAPSDISFTPDPVAVDRWEKVLELIRIAFADGDVPSALCNGALVLIPKATPGQFRGIALLEVVYKLISSICNRRIQSAIEFDDAIHGFRPKRGTGTAIIETKLLMQLNIRMDNPIYLIFIDLKKAYDTLDREAAIRILSGYGVGPNIIRILRAIWKNDLMVPRQAGYYGKQFRAYRGVRQGDIISPLIFNIMVDCVIRHWRHCSTNAEDSVIFYADDGMLGGSNPVTLQESLDIFTKGFKALGLQMNALKTEFMVPKSRATHCRLSTAAYTRKITGTGNTHTAIQKAKVQCINCGTLVNRSCLARHQQSRKCKTDGAAYVPPSPVRARVEREVMEVTPREEPNQFEVSIPRGCTTDTPCPVPGCVFKVVTNHAGK